MKYMIQTGDIMQKERNCVLSGNSEYIFCSFESLPQNLGTYIPIGSVEFVEEFARLNCVAIPSNITYPEELRAFLKRRIWRDIFSHVDPDFFVKPVKTKLFTGSLKKNIAEAVSDDEPVWVSDALEFQAEFRFYVLRGKILGFSRYDDGDNEVEVNVDTVQKMIDSFSEQPVGFAIDVGISNNETVLVEINDGWSLGYYPWGNLTKEDYVELITERWKQISEQK